VAYSIHNSTLQNVVQFITVSLQNVVRFTTVPFKTLFNSQQYPSKLCSIHNSTLQNFYPSKRCSIHNSTLQNVVQFTTVPFKTLFDSQQYPSKLCSIKIAEEIPKFYHRLFENSLFSIPVSMWSDLCLLVTQTIQLNTFQAALQKNLF